MKKLSAILMALCLMGSLASCGGGTKPAGDTAAPSGGKKLTVAWLGSGESKEQLDSSIAPYTAETGNTVESIYIPGTWAEYFTKMQTMIAGGDPLDCAFIAIEGKQMFVDLGLAAPFTDFAEANSEEFQAIIDDVHPKIFDALSVDGVLYGAPTEWNNVVMHLNKDRFEAAGVELPDENWDKAKFLEICEKLTGEKDGVKQYAVCIPDGYFNSEAYLFNNSAGFMTDDFQKSTINSPESAEIFQLWQDLVKLGYAPIPEQNVDAIQQLINGTVAMGAWGRWPTTQYVDAGFKNVAIQYLPKFKENMPIIGAGGIFVMRSSQNYDDATRLAIWLAKPQFIESFYSYGPIPCSKTVADKVIPALGFPDNNEIFYGSADRTKPVHSPAQYPECESIFLRARSEIVVNGADVQSTLDAAAAEMDAVLAANA